MSRKRSRLVMGLAAAVIPLSFSCEAGSADAPQASRPVAEQASANPSNVPAPTRTGTDWPIFLGPHQSGVSDEVDLLDVWPAEGPPLVWEETVGTGYSAPSIRGNRLVSHHRVDDDEVVECRRADDGSLLWTTRYPSNFRDPYGYNNGPRCSPLLTEAHCYTLGAEGKLLCVELETGSQVWMRDLLKDFNVPDGFFGVGSTPVLEGDKLIVAVGGQPNSGVVAFNAMTGDTLWENVGRDTWDGAETGWTNDPTYSWSGDEMIVSYSSPVVATIHGQRHVLCLLRHGLVSLDPETGHERFHHWFRSRTHESVNAACPVVVDDTILLSAAYRVGSTLLKVAPSGNDYEVVWSDPRNLMTHWSTAIHLDGCYLGFSGRHENEGALRCIDAATGDVRWETTGFDRPLSDLARGPDGEIIDVATKQVIPWPLFGRGSSILVDGKFIILAERGGTLALAKATTESYQEISRCTIPQMHYPSWTAPVLSRGRLYLRCEDALICLDLKKTDSQPSDAR